MLKPEDQNDLVSAATGAYRQDGRGTGWCSRASSSDWHPRLNRLLQNGHIFLGYRFSGNGVLFRGMPNGFLAGLAEKVFWHSMDAAPLCRLERDLDVIFCSETARDALAAAKPWQGHQDAAVLVFNSSGYAARWRKRAAAVLGFADVGMVFKYPCLAEPLHLSDLCGVLMAPDTLAEACRLLADSPSNHTEHLFRAPPRQTAGSRDSWYRLMEDMLLARDLEPALAKTCDEYPGSQNGNSGEPL